MKRSSGPTDLRGSEGQAITEMLIFLPTLLILFLGVIYLKEMNDTKIRAIEAARYVTWQGVWYVRGAYKGGSGGTVKTPTDLATELRQVGLGRYLVEARADMARPSSDFTLGDYVDKFTTTSPPAGDPLGTFATPRLFPLPPTFSPNGALLGAMTPAAGASAIGSLLSLAGNVAFVAQDYFAQNTKWTDESKKTIYAARVAYRFGGAGLFGAIPQIMIVERSNLLSHPYNVERTDNQGEYDEMFGCPPKESCGGRTKPDESHVFDLWLFPSNPVPGTTFTGPVSSVIKDIASGNFPPVNLLSSIPPPFDIFAWPKMPEGTLKEYPELNMTK
jgi:hypothetical protein